MTQFTPLAYSLFSGIFAGLSCFCMKLSASGFRYVPPRRSQTVIYCP